MAYASKNRNYVYGNTLYIAGTSKPSDLITDLTIPIKNLNKTERYKISEKLLEQNPDVDTIIGHSLGGAIASTLIEKYYSHPTRKVQARVYGSATEKHLKNIKYYRHKFDPVSIFNVNPDVNTFYFKGFNPHSYEGF